MKQGFNNNALMQQFLEPRKPRFLAKCANGDQLLANKVIFIGFYQHTLQIVVTAVVGAFPGKTTLQGINKTGFQPSMADAIGFYAVWFTILTKKMIFTII